MIRNVTLRSGAAKGLYNDGKDSSVAALPQNDMIRETL